MRSQNIRMMTIKFLLVLISSGIFFIGSSVAAEGSSAVKQMAAMLLDFHHYPSEANKSTLKTIINSESTRQYERTIAKAIMNIEHKANSSDIAALEKIVTSKDTTDNEKDLATSVINFNHEPTAKDKKRLETMK